MSSLKPGVEFVSDAEAIGTSRMPEEGPRKLLYVNTNVYNACIYQDHECQYYYLAGNTNLEILPEVLVRWHDERWIDDQGRNFFRTDYPQDMSPSVSVKEL